MPTLVTGPGQRLVRSTGGTLGTLLHEVEGVERGEQLGGPRQRVEGVVLGREAGVAVGVPGGGDELDGLGGGGGAAPGPAGHDALGTSDRRVPRVATVDLGALDDDLTADDRGRPEQRLLQEVGAVEDRVGQPELVRGLPAQRLALVERVLDDQGDRLVGTEEVRHEPGTAPARDQAEHDLGQADGRRGVHDGAVGAVQRDLEAAAEGEAVDEAERRLAAVLQLAEDRVAQLAHGAYGIGAAALDRGEVGACGEDERLAGHCEGVDRVVGQRRVDGGVELEERGGAEGVGPGVVLAVVEGDQADGHAGQGDLAQRGPRDALGVGDDGPGTAQQVAHVGAHAVSPFEWVGSAPIQCGFSQITVPPMPMPMHMVVRP